MDCKAARLIIDLACPGRAELDAVESAALDDHLEDCLMCRSHADFEWRVDDHLGRAMRALSVPMELRARLLGRLHRERTRWYSRTVWAPIAAAAAIVMAVGIGGGVYQRLHPVSHDQMAIDYPSMLPREEVEQRFRDEFGLVVEAPPQFDYEYLPGIRVVEFQGRQVPELQFTRSGYQAVVYVLSDEHFEANSELPKREGMFATILRHPTNSHVVYVVYFSGERLERFLENQGQHTV